MTRKNVELQLQALELIQRKYGITPQSFVPKKKVDEVQGTSKNVHNSPSIENEIMEDVVKWDFGTWIASREDFFLRFNLGSFQPMKFPKTTKNIF